jgi:hypothetical protein
VSGAGDVNGDGIGDIIISAPDWDLNTTITGTGRSYVVFGHRGAWPAVVELSTLDGTNGFTITGNLQGEYNSFSVSAGDINNDGLSDIIVGAPGWNNYTGRTVVVYGSCPSKMKISSGQCVNCTLGNGCLACDMVSGACTSCPDDRWIDGTGCKTCDAPCVSCNGPSKACTLCPSKMKISGTGCVNCTLGNGCLACDMTSGDCTLCPSGKVISGTGCADCPAGTWSEGGGTAATCTAIGSSSHVVIIIEFIIDSSDDQTTAEDVKHEIERVTGVDVVVVMIEKGKFEVTVVGGDAIDATDLAKKLADIQRDGTTTSDLLRRIKTVTLRIDALSGIALVDGIQRVFVVVVAAIFAMLITTTN